ncbi:asparagine synthetase domain-containing protein 1-like [Uloborus diversus]|uniref:asparagine synthetase domain-containing protein 1-like n=1 Tax=Uloborus diversus TaxID=327109 RepID=UPI0024091D42|nr:asparagine synthetase domain-containing protein 1-like [Uloborus diversus]
MCGICASVVLRSAEDKIPSQDVNSALTQELKNLYKRGPDYIQNSSTTFCDVVDLFFCSSVLHHRGTSIVQQPVKDDLGNILLWNGEVFDGPLIPEKCDSDTRLLSEKLFSLSKVEEILEVFSSIQGPYAFIFYQSSGYLWFGRDIFGRRSLLWSFGNLEFQLCSVSSFNKTNWEEVPAEGLFCLDLARSMHSKSLIITKYPWSTTASGKTNKFLQEDRIPSQPTIVTHPTLKLSPPIRNPLNVLIPTEEETLCDMMNMTQCSEKEFFQKLLSLPDFSTAVDAFEKVLSDAVGKRVCNRHRICKKCYALRHVDDTSDRCGHSSLGVLFSGGLDSIVIALLTDRYLLEGESVDLINVAFSKSENKSRKMSDQSFDTPDRITGKDGVKALRKICPKRNWNFVQVNVDEKDLFSKRNDTISDLLSPSCTVLDDSIGCALWFAAWGEGTLDSVNDEASKTYTSPARVMLLGMGADEQLAGYSRHRAKFKNGEWTTLIEELSMELDRIGSRNLGRDDRIISDHAVESRYPFLDEEVVSFLNSLPVWLKANLNFPRGVGEKLLLRLLAAKLGLLDAATLPKRAIQFGSRIARMENSKEKGSDFCQRLKVL